jgi:hypothetical protein
MEPAGTGPMDTDGVFTDGQTGVFDDGLDETADPEAVCYTKDGDGLTGVSHTCNGFLQILPYPDELGTPYSWSLGESAGPFPVAEAMACCDPIDPGLPYDEQTHFAMCQADALSLACRSMEVVWGHLATLELDPERAAEMATIASWTGTPEGLAACENYAWATNGSGDIEDSWYLLQEPSAPELVILTEESTRVLLTIALSGIDQVEPTETCDSNLENDVLVLPIPGASDFEATTQVADAVLLGPTYNEHPVSGSVDFDSESNAIGISQSDSTHWTLDRFAVWATAAASVGDGTASANVADFYAQLAWPTETIAGTTTGFTVPSGDAMFVVAGSVSGLPYSLHLRNQTPIIVRKLASGWAISSFGLQFTDSNNANWNLTIAAPRWD